MVERVARAVIGAYRKFRANGGLEKIPQYLQTKTTWKPTQFDAVLCLALMIFIPMLRAIMDKMIFKPLARRLCLDAKLRKLKRLPDKDALKVKKFIESSWKFFYYTTMTSLSYYVTSDEPWFTDTTHFWIGYPHMTLRMEVKILYVTQLAFYLQGVFYLLFVEIRRKDFPVMLGHHVVTITLIAFSWYCNYLRVGCMVLMLHDPADIFLEGAKINNYAKNELASTLLFVGLLITWAVTRLYYFPFQLIRSTLYESIAIVKDGDLVHYEVFNALLIALVLMHVYWYFLMLRIAARKVFSGKLDDERESKDDSDSD